MKEANGSPGEDIREWSGRGPNRSQITSRFFTNIALWLHGLTTIKASGVYLRFSETNRPTEYTNAFDTLPFAIVNVKKQPGGGTAINHRLSTYNLKHEKRNSLFLREELEILNPNILVCGGPDGTVMRIVTDLVFPDEFAQVNNRAYYAKSRGVVLIDSYHPSAWVAEPRAMYERVMNAYGQFLAGAKRN
jgi:hypothetical protein